MHEHKADIITSGATPGDVKDAVDALGRAFEEYKAANNQLDAARNQAPFGQGGDVVLEEKVNRINGDLTQMQAKMDRLHMALNRPAVGGAGRDLPENAQEHKSAFYGRFVRKGVERGLAELEEKALNTGTADEGGYAVPDDLDRQIDGLLKDVSPIRAVANVVRIGTANYRKLVNLSDAASGWVGESDARAETAAPTFAEVVPPLGEIYANPAATQAMLDDAFFDVEVWLAEELATEFGVQEGTAFVTGNGTNKPKGFLTYTTSTAGDSARAFGTLQHIATGVSGGFPASDPADKLIDLVHSLRPVYRNGAVFAMNTNTLSAIRKFKDADGNYLWRPGLADGAPATLMGYRVIEVQDMPDVAADSLSVAFGNFQRGYTITDRTGVRLLRDPFSNKPFVHFYTTKRVGGGVVNSEAIKLLKFSV